MTHCMPSIHLDNLAQDVSDHNDDFGDLVVIPRCEDLDGATGFDVVERGIALALDLENHRLRAPDFSWNIWTGRFRDEDTGVRYAVLVIARSEKEAAAVITAKRTPA